MSEHLPPARYSPYCQRSARGVALAIAALFAFAAVGCPGDQSGDSRGGQSDEAAAGEEANGSGAMAAGAQDGAAGMPSRRGRSDPPGTTIVLTGETWGWLEPCGCTVGMLGGLPRRAALLARLKAAGHTPIALDLGDLMEEPGEQTDLKLEALAEAYRVMGIRAMAVGDRDVMIGLDRIGLVSEAGGFALIATNLRTPGGESPEQTAASLRVETAEGVVRVLAFIGESLREEIEALSQGALTVGPVAVPPLPRGERGAGESAASEAASSRAAPVSTIALFHGTVEEAVAALGRAPGIGVIAVAASEELPGDPVRLAGGALLVTVGTKGKFAGLLRPRIRAGASAASPGGLRFEQTGMEALSDRVPDHSEVWQIYVRYRETLFERNLVADMPVLAPEGGRFVGAETCGGCHPKAFAVYRDKMRHSRSFESLQAKNATRDPECLRCHTTGFGYASGFQGIEVTPAVAHVSCESCHGVGSTHANSGGFASEPYGHIPSPEALCIGCHDAENSPNFDFGTYWEKIRHGR